MFSRPPWASSPGHWAPAPHTPCSGDPCLHPCPPPQAALHLSRFRGCLGVMSCHLLILVWAEARSQKGPTDLGERWAVVCRIPKATTQVKIPPHLAPKAGTWKQALASCPLAVLWPLPPGCRRTRPRACPKELVLGPGIESTSPGTLAAAMGCTGVDASHWTGLARPAPLPMQLHSCRANVSLSLASSMHRKLMVQCPTESQPRGHPALTPRCTSGAAGGRCSRAAPPPRLWGGRGEELRHTAHGQHPGLESSQGARAESVSYLASVAVLARWLGRCWAWQGAPRPMQSGDPSHPQGTRHIPKAATGFFQLCPVASWQLLEGVWHLSLSSTQPLEGVMICLPPETHTQGGQGVLCRPNPAACNTAIPSRLRRCCSSRIQPHTKAFPWLHLCRLLAAQLKGEAAISSKKRNKGKSTSPFYTVLT